MPYKFSKPILVKKGRRYRLCRWEKGKLVNVNLATSTRRRKRRRTKRKEYNSRAKPKSLV